MRMTATSTGVKRVRRGVRGAALLAWCGVLLALAFAHPAWAAGKDNEVNTHQLPDSSFLYDTTIAELATADSYMDKQTVQVKGEAVGDIIQADFDGAHCWITLTSLAEKDDSTVAVYMTDTASKSIDTLGAYGKRGTILQVRGTFHLACREHDGVSDLHADSVTVVTPGEVVEQPVNPTMGIAGLIVLAVGVAMMVLYRFLRDRKR